MYASVMAEWAMKDVSRVTLLSSAVLVAGQQLVDIAEREGSHLQTAATAIRRLAAGGF